ncbi:MAG: hypothetical protein HQ532_03940, partial [Candidatus Omnitrophica bacterium]|nr:hypothetical protein [Candidatus Omnitrophota bacterium]
VLIFMLIGALLCQNIAYAAPNLRANLMFDAVNKWQSEERVKEVKGITLSKSETIKRLKLVLAPFKPNFKEKEELSAAPNGRDFSSAIRLGF